MNPSTDPVSVLLNTENNRTQAAQDLGRDLASLADSITTYKDAWRTATAAGWARTDLLRAGFLDPTKLPRISARAALRNAGDSTDE